MKKFLFALACLGLAASLQATKLEKLAVIKDEGFKSDDYSKLRVYSVSDAEFLKTIEGKKNYDAVADQLNQVNLAVKLKVTEFATAGYTPGKGPKTLTLTMAVAEYNPGSTGAAIMMGGFGAGNGHCKYTVHFWDGKTEVATIETAARISHTSGAFGRHATNGDASRDRIPMEMVAAIEKFLQKH
jgi:hypothetical protein